MAEEPILVVIGGEAPAHTPTPWMVVGPTDLRIVGRGGELIADIGEWSRPDYAEEYGADAAFIVQACNLHADLVEALAVMTEHAGETYPHFESERGQRDIKQAQAVLAKAREVTSG